jgi:hypothetical protein
MVSKWKNKTYLRKYKAAWARKHRTVKVRHHSKSKWGNKTFLRKYKEAWMKRERMSMKRKGLKFKKLHGHWRVISRR